MRARYLPPDSDRALEYEVLSGEDVEEVLARTARATSGRGTPAVEILGDDGSVLVIGQTHAGAVLLLVDPLGQAMHSVGSRGDTGMVVFDYFGSFTEVPAEFVVSTDLCREAAGAFVRGASLESVGVVLESD